MHPRIEARYKSSEVKAYFKQQPALRVETTVDNPNDLGIIEILNPGQLADVATNRRRG